MEIHNLSIKEIHKGLTQKEFSAREVVENFLERRRDEQASKKRCSLMVPSTVWCRQRCDPASHRPACSDGHWFCNHYPSSA